MLCADAEMSEPTTYVTSAIRSAAEPTCVGSAEAGLARAGRSAVYDSSPLQRRLRDVHVGAQHAHAQQRQYVDVGKLALRRSAGHAG